MKRLILIAAALVLVLAMPLAAQTGGFDFGTFTGDFDTFAAEVAGGLTFNSTLGLNWADAHIGNFLHFGVGATLGATTIPFEAASAVLDTINLTLPTDVTDIIADYGMPIPGIMAEARLGGFGLPFDMGVKYGELLPELQSAIGLPSNIVLDYLVAGADVRFRLVEERGLIPMLSVGGGVNYMQGGIGLNGLLGGSQTITIDLDPPFSDIDSA